MRSAEELRADVRHLLAMARNLSDVRLKRELASQALVLAQLAEAGERIGENPELVRAIIARCRSLLSYGIRDEVERKIVGEFLADAEARWVAQPAAATVPNHTDEAVGNRLTPPTRGRGS
jgi:hypothetical protein